MTQFRLSARGFDSRTFTLHNMRKIIVLIMTSVLATGAVANADTVNVTENPADFMNVNGIYSLADTDTPSTTLLGTTDEIIPVGPTTSLQSGTQAHRMQLEIKDENSTLEQVAVCLYNPAVLDTSTKVSDTCGSGFDGAPPSNLSNPSVTGTGSPYSAFTASYVPGGIGSDGTVNALHTGHKVGKETHGSASVMTNEFGGVDQGSNVVHKVDIRFLLTDLAVNASGWKLRIFSTYNDAGARETIEFIDSGSYSVGYLGTIKTASNPRGQVDFGDVIADNSVTKTNLDTADYRANNTSDITLSAGTVFKDGSNLLGFAATNGSPGTDEISLACGAISGTPQYLTAADEAKTLLASVPSLADESKTLATDITADQHECTLYVGEVATGTYTSEMTVGIGKS